MEDKVESLLPHRYPFLFVDEIVSATESEIIGIKTFDSEIDKMLKGSFPSSNFIPGMIIIESMAQCGGAGIKQLGLADGTFGLVSLESVMFLKGVTYDEEIRYVIQNIRVSNRLIKQTGKAYSFRKLVAEATWTCARIEQSNLKVNKIQT